jgi:hypothetical protein
MSSVARWIPPIMIAFLLLCSPGLCTVLINEVELNPPDNATMWVELYNTGNAAVDLTGWTVKIVEGAWIGSIPLSGSIDPRGFQVAEGDPKWVPDTNGTVSLTDNNGKVVDKTPVLSDSKHNDFTYSRVPDGKNTGTISDFAFVMGTKGRSNVGASGTVMLG